MKVIRNILFSGCEQEKEQEQEQEKEKEKEKEKEIGKLFNSTYQLRGINKEDFFLYPNDTDEPKILESISEKLFETSDFELYLSLHLINYFENDLYFYVELFPKHFLLTNFNLLNLENNTHFNKDNFLIYLRHFPVYTLTGFCMNKNYVKRAKNNLFEYYTDKDINKILMFFKSIFFHKNLENLSENLNIFKTNILLKFLLQQRRIKQFNFSNIVNELKDILLKKHISNREIYDSQIDNMIKMMREEYGEEEIQYFEQIKEMSLASHKKVQQKNYFEAILNSYNDHLH